MICSKCNSEIPNGAKFCTVCGTPCAAAEPAKTFCAKCGMELAAGARFCTSCGTPTAANPAPAANDAQAVANNAASAVSLNKEPNADDLVAAMNTAAPAAPAPAPAPAAAVPAPVSAPAPASVPTPVAAPAASVAPAPVQTPAASVMPQPGYNNGFAPTGAPTAPQMPNYAPTSGQMPPVGDAAGLNGAAVAAVVPEKVKKSPVGKIILIIGIVLVAVIGAAAAWFFSNKPSFLSTFMGKPKYAAMVEKETFKKISKDMDAEALSSQIKTLTSVAGTFASRAVDQLGSLAYGGADNLYLSDKTAAGAEYADMMQINSNNPFDGIDVKGMISSYHDFMQSTYGANAITGNISVKVEDLGGLGNADDVLKILNGMNITYDYAATENAVGTLIGAEFGNGGRFDYNAIIEDDGSIYIAFPFASKTGFKIKTTSSGSSSEIQGTAGLELEPEEITRLFEEITSIYTDHVKKASVDMNSGSLIVAGKEVSGKLIVADISGKNLENMVKEIFEHIANDEYFCKQIVEYINNFDSDYTAADFKNGVTDLVSDISGISENDKLIVKTIVNNGGKTLAKSFGFVDSGEMGMEIAYADNDTESVIELKIEGETVFNMTNVKTDDKNGTITLNFATMQNEDSFISVIVDYAGVDEVEFGKSKVEVGSYTVKMSVPSDLDIDSEALDMINGSSFTSSTTVSGSTINYAIGATIANVAKFDLKMDLTISDDTSVLTPPSDVIDITDIANGGEPDKATQDKLMGFLEDLTQAVEGSGLEEIFGDLFGSGSIGGTQPLPNDPVIVTDPKEKLRESFYDLEDEVWVSLFDVYGWKNAYETTTGSPADIMADEYQDKLDDLLDRISEVAYGDAAGLTENKLEEFRKEYKEILKEQEGVVKALWNESKVPNKPDPASLLSGSNQENESQPNGTEMGPTTSIPAFSSNVA